MQGNGKILHRKIENTIFFTDGISLHHVGMTYFGSGAGFAIQTFDILLVISMLILQNLQRHLAVKRNLPGKINHAHAAAGNGVFYQKISEYHAGSYTALRNRDNIFAFWAGDLFTGLFPVHRKIFFTFFTKQSHHSPSASKEILQNRVFPQLCHIYSQSFALFFCLNNRYYFLLHLAEFSI